MAQSNLHDTVNPPRLPGIPLAVRPPPSCYDTLNPIRDQPERMGSGPTTTDGDSDLRISDVGGWDLGACRVNGFREWELGA